MSTSQRTTDPYPWFQESLLPPTAYHLRVELGMVGAANTAVLTWTLREGDPGTLIGSECIGSSLDRAGLHEIFARAEQVAQEALTRLVPFP